VARLFRVIVPVSGIDEALRFYETVLGVPGATVSAGRVYFDCEGTILALYDPEADGDGRPATPNPEPLYLAVSDLAATYGACRAAGGRFPHDAPADVGPMGEIRTRPWGETSFYVQDPFGNVLCFVDRDTIFAGRGAS
jgi:catechol 2,3-dioxygenase-like lactoylglutathione lyase family enzyme